MWFLLERAFESPSSPHSPFSCLTAGEHWILEHMDNYRTPLSPYNMYFKLNPANYI
jgi:hypothetical protein